MSVDLLAHQTDDLGGGKITIFADGSKAEVWRVVASSMRDNRMAPSHYRIHCCEEDGLTHHRKNPRKGSAQHPPRGADTASARRPRTSVKIKRAVGGKTYELVHPACARERTDDLAEVHAMIAAGEIDVAVDELRWLLEECRDFIAVHALLAELAAADGDVKLARAHFGFAFDLGWGAVPSQGLDAPLAYLHEPNRHFLEAAKGLAWSLSQMGQTNQAREVLLQLLSLDPSDPLHARAMLDGTADAH